MSNHDASTLDVKFEFQGPRRTSDERHYFKTVQENYAERMKRKKNSLSELIDKLPSKQSSGMKKP